MSGGAHGSGAYEIGGLADERESGHPGSLLLQAGAADRTARRVAALAVAAGLGLWFIVWLGADRSGDASTRVEQRGVVAPVPEPRPPAEPTPPEPAAKLQVAPSPATAPAARAETRAARPAPAAIAPRPVSAASRPAPAPAVAEVPALPSAPPPDASSPSRELPDVQETLFDGESEVAPTESAPEAPGAAEPGT